MRSSLINGLSGAVLTQDEARFLREARPAGIILFARNCSAPEQVRRLTGEALAAIGDRALVLIDQEGGRVRRLRPPQWRELPPAGAFARLHAADRVHGIRLARVVARLTAADLSALGITMNCAPVLDLRIAGAHDIIGDRAYGETVEQVAALGRAVADGLMAGGVCPVIKHIPGHGRALADSHLELPSVGVGRSELEGSDFATFRALRDVPAAMTAHVLYTAVDPARPATLSSAVIGEVIRGSIGFDGLLMSDALEMKALAGERRELAAAAIAAGCDVVLECTGNLVEAQAAAAGVPALAGQALARFEHALAVGQRVQPFDVAEAEAALEGMLRAAA